MPVFNRQLSSSMPLMSDVIGAITRCVRQLRTLGFLLVLTIPVSVSSAQQPSGDERALAQLFGERVAYHALDVYQQSRQLDPRERYQYLLKKVLPKQSSQIRLVIDYLPTNLSPPVIEEYGRGEPLLRFPSGTIRRPSGGVLVSPAIELVKVAQQLGKLEELRAEVRQRSSEHPEQVKAQLAIQILIAWVQEDPERADQLLAKLSALAAESEVTDVERSPESVVVWEGFRAPSSRNQIRDLMYNIFGQSQGEVNVHRERFRRHMSSMRHLDELILGRYRSSVYKHRFSLQQWQPVSRCTAETRGGGYPHAVWMADGNSVRKVTCHDSDYVYFSSPLQGNYAFEGDLSVFGYQEIRIAVGTHWLGPRYTLYQCEQGNFRRKFERHRVDPPMGKMGKRMHVRVTVQDGQRTTFVNGRNVFQKPHRPEDDPWLAAYTPWYTTGLMENVRITGRPEIPAEIDLIAKASLPGWLPYYDESIGSPDSSWSLQLDGSGFPVESSNSSRGEQLPVLIGRRGAAARGSHQESLLRYHRPMLEDGTIEYEFYYKAGEIGVFPALDRLAFLFDRRQAGIHWITDGLYDRTSIESTNFTPHLRKQSETLPLPLKADAWNRVRLSLKGDRAEVQLNGERIISHTLEPENQRTFGLFHFADQTEVRVRNLRWRGEWPKELPPVSEQELADVSWEKELARDPELPVVFEHDFSEGLPSEQVWGAGEDWQSHVKQHSDGVRMTLAGGLNTYNMLAFPFSLQGDFDVTLDFQGFRHTPGSDSEGNIQLQIYFDDENSSECRFYRNHFHHSKTNIEHKIQAAIFRQDTPRGRYEFPSQFPLETTAGRLRLVRRGATVFYLYADAESQDFRLIHREDVTASPVTFAGIKAVLETHRSGTTSVVWKRITVRAENPLTPQEKRSPTLAELNQQRELLPKVAEFKFDQHPAPRQLIVTGTSENLKREPEGWLLAVPGTRFWSSTGVACRQGIAGDFDVTLDLDVLKLNETESLHESIVMLKILLDSRIRRGVEIKLANSVYGKRELEIQRNTYHRNSREARYEKLKFQRLDDVSQLRLARRGEVVYLIYRKSAESEAKVFGSLELGREDVLPHSLEALVHTGDEGRETIARFKSLKIYAEEVR